MRSHPVSWTSSAKKHTASASIDTLRDELNVLLVGRVDDSLCTKAGVGGNEDDERRRNSNWPKPWPYVRNARGTRN